MPPKKKPRKRRVPTKKGLKQKQKQKQRQVVNVQVSSGGGGSGGFIPIPQAPSIDYGLISNLLRPANTVDVPIRAAAPMAESIATRPAETQTLAEEFARPSRPAPETPITSSKDLPSEELEVPVAKARKVRSDAGVPRGRSKSPKSREFERMVEAQKSGSFM